jgi:oxygen-independent coproporphyrinogen-3 oxidase
MLSTAGYAWYEISNWCRPGEECRHNLLYWSQGDYVGVGCAAHGHRRGRRSWNVGSIDRYIERIRAGVSPEAGHERLDEGRRADEALLLGLRTRGGAVVADLTATGPLADLAADLWDAGLVDRVDGARIVLTRRGRLLANDVTARLLNARDRQRLGALVPGPVGTR